MDRAKLRAALRQRYLWTADPDVGPSAVEAGECDRCGHEARLVELCGPGAARYVGRRCAAELGVHGWCQGHAAAARDALRRLAGLPREADDVARLWWVATGEVRLDPALLDRATSMRLPLGPGGVRD